MWISKKLHKGSSLGGFRFDVFLNNKAHTVRADLCTTLLESDGRFLLCFKRFSTDNACIKHMNSFRGNLSTGWRILQGFF